MMVTKLLLEGETGPPWWVSLKIRYFMPNIFILGTSKTIGNVSFYTFVEGM